MIDENRNIAEKWAEIYGKKEIDQLKAEVERLKEIEDTASAAFKTVSDQIQEIERLKADLLTVAESKASIRAGGLERAAVIVDGCWKRGTIDESDCIDIAAAIRKEVV